MKLVNRRQLAEIFNSSPTSISTWKNCPKHSRGKWDADKVAKYIIDEFPTGKIKKAARIYLDKRKNDDLAPGDDELKIEGFSKNPGLEGVVSRLRSIETATSLQYIKKLSEGNYGEAEFFRKQWSDTCDTLVKLEKQFDEIMTKRGAVVSIDKASEFFFSKVIPLKQQLKSFGADTCHDLSTMDDPKECRKYVEGKIMEIMRGL